jgi:hypothetical protein
LHRRGIADPAEARVRWSGFTLGAADIDARFRDESRVAPMDTIEAWKCIGCGNIEAPQTCIGVCQYRKVQLVDAFEHEHMLADLRNAQQSRQRVRDELLRRLAYVTPRDGEWERSYRALQNEARRALNDADAA